MASLQSIFRKKTAEKVNRKLGVESHDNHGHPHAHDEVMGHVMPVPLLLSILLVLLFLTFITVAVTWVDLGRQLNLVVALGIAVVKAALVCLYFMHLRYDNPFNGIALIASFLFVALFIGVTILDSGQYKPQISPRTVRLQPSPAPDLSAGEAAPVPPQ
jgi:cytochrome c oxidase subunit 4